MFKPRTWSLVVLALLAAACVKSDDFNPQQREVFDAMQAWSHACAAKDTDRLWEMLSPASRTYYAKELPDNLQPTVRRERKVLEEGSLASEEQKRKVREFLAELPDNPDAMTPKEYHTWWISRELTPENIGNQAQLFSRENVENIRIEGDRATVYLSHGKQRTYTWHRVDGDWKFDVMPSMLRAIEATKGGASN